MKLPFCSNLQKRWILESIDYKSLNEIEIRLSEYLEQDLPPVDGRHGSDILSWPTQLNKTTSIKIEVTEAMYFNVSDHYSPSLFGGNEAIEGDTFQRISGSKLQALYENASHKNLFHYRVLTRDEVIEFLAFSAPIVLID